MLFNSFQFLLFLPVVFLLYSLLQTKKQQNIFILLSSYFFYSWWDWRFLSLIILSSCIDYWAGKKMEETETPSARKGFLALSMVGNLGMLAFFKYFNFFSASLQEALDGINIAMTPMALNIILPVGISFYTFQTMSYTIDVYKKRIQSTKDPIAFFTYVSFFPQLVAGPIERAHHLLPQFEKKRVFDYSTALSGGKLILWGFFKKLVIADNCAVLVNAIFINYEDKGSIELILGSVFFAFQIYCDFSGYSDIAIGVSRLFNISLMKNFNYPYFSKTMGEFWRRWHISLNTWFRDYLYIPIGGSRGTRLFVIRNIFIVFVISGLWHGANWTFIVWGALNAVYFLPSLFTKNKDKSNVESNSFWSNSKGFFQILFTFSLTCIAWIFFRSPTIGDALEYLNGIISFTPSNNLSQYFLMLMTIVLFLFIEWMGRKKECPIDLAIARKPVKYLYYGIYVYIIVYFGATEEHSFIYFQF